MSFVINPYRFGGLIGTNPTSTNLWGWWSLSDTSDEAGTFSNLTNNNTATFTSGYNGNALTLDGVNQYLSLADEAWPTGAQTWAVFIKPANLTGSQCIMTKGGSSSGNYGINWFVNSSGNITFVASSNGTVFAVTTSTTTVAALSWVHVAVVYDPGAGTPYIKIFIDGVEDVSNTTSIPAQINDSTAAFCIGTLDSGSNPFEGQIDDACIFDKALSTDEVKWLVHNTYADLT